MCTLVSPRPGSLFLIPVAPCRARSSRRRCRQLTHPQWQLAAKKRQINLFDDEPKLDLEFQDFRIRVAWRCGTQGTIDHCDGHDMAILDWGASGNWGAGTDETRP